MIALRLAATLAALLSCGAAGAQDRSAAASQTCAPGAETSGVCFAGVDAWFAGPTRRYDHAILGDDIEWGTLVLSDAAGGLHEATLPETHVFEDIAPRLADLDGDGSPEIVVIETEIERGAALAVYGLRDGELTRLAATPSIGRTHRWLAVAGIADFDGDGRVEVAYIDRPHLTKILRVVEVRPDPSGWELAQELEADGYTNHHIGSSEIEGGLRQCGDAPELVLSDGAWLRVLVLSGQGGRWSRGDLGAYTGPESLRAALGC